MVPIFNVAGGPGISQVASSSLTTALIFPVLTAGQIFAKSVSTNPAPAYGSSPVVVPYPGSGRLEGKYSFLTAAGWVTVGGSTPTVAATLYSGTSLTPGSNTVIKTSGAQTLVTSASYPWMVTLEGIGDTQSGLFEGIAEFLIGGNLVARAAVTPLTGLLWSSPALTAATASQPNVASEPVFSLCIGITFGVANAANVAQLDQLILES